MNRDFYSTRGIKIVFFIALLLAVLQVFVSNRLVSLDTKLATIQNRTDTLLRENEELSQAVASSSSLTTIFIRAQESGYVKGAKFLFLNHSNTIALEK